MLPSWKAKFQGKLNLDIYGLVEALFSNQNFYSFFVFFLMENTSLF